MTEVGDIVDCVHCGSAHTVKDSDPPTLMYVKCGDVLRMVGIKGKRVHFKPKAKPEPGSRPRPAHVDKGATEEELREGLRWVAQTNHQAHHEGPLEECPKSTCDYVMTTLGKKTNDGH